MTASQEELRSVELMYTILLFKRLIREAYNLILRLGHIEIYVGNQI
jgi:hypothetical protein